MGPPALPQVRAADRAGWHHAVDAHRMVQHLPDAGTACRAGDGACGPGNGAGMGRSSVPVKKPAPAGETAAESGRPAGAQETLLRSGREGA